MFQLKDGSPWIPTKTDVEVLVAADGEDWGSSDTVCLTAGQSESWTLTQDDQGSRFRYFYYLRREIKHAPPKMTHLFGYLVNCIVLLDKCALKISEMHCTGLLIQTTGLDCRFSNYVTVITIGSYSWSTDCVVTA